MNILEKKAALRRLISSQLKKIDASQRELYSAGARARLSSQPVWINARSVLFFFPRKDELDLWPMVKTAFASGKRVTLPRYEPSNDTYQPAEILDPDLDLHPGPYSIPEPVPGCAVFPVNQLDLVLVPGVAFDVLGRRLGRGKGYYDRILATLRGVSCGAGFDQQVVSEIPVAPHDACLTCILTPTRWFHF